MGRDSLTNAIKKVAICLYAYSPKCLKSKKVQEPKCKKAYIQNKTPKINSGCNNPPWDQRVGGISTLSTICTTPFVAEMSAV